MARCPDCGSILGHTATCPHSVMASVLTEEVATGRSPAPTAMTEPPAITEYRRGGPPELDPNLLLEVRRLREQMAKQMEAVPRSVGFSCAGAWPAAGNLLLLARPGSPARGRLWHVRSFTAVGGAPVTNAGDAAVVHVFVGPQPPSPTMGDLAYGWRDRTATSLPIPAFYGDYELVVRSGERLYFLITGGTAARVYTVTGYVKDEPEVVAGAEPVYQE